MDWEKYGFVIASLHRKRIVLLLAETSATPLQISRKLGIRLSYVSSLLKDLKERKIIKCITPELRKGRIYKLTPLGEKIAKHL